MEDKNEKKKIEEMDQEDNQLEQEPEDNNKGEKEHSASYKQIQVQRSIGIKCDAL